MEEQTVYIHTYIHTYIIIMRTGRTRSQQYLIYNHHENRTDWEQTISNAQSS